MSHLRTALSSSAATSAPPLAAPAVPRRRRRRAAAATSGVLLLALAVTGCAAPAASSSSTSPDSLGTASIALSWIKNYESAGYYFAEQNGDYTDAGFDDVDLIAGGGNTNSWDLVLSGQAEMGLASDLTGITGAINDGAELKIIGAQFVKNPVGFVSLAANPISTVADLTGKRIGVDAGGKLAVEAVLKANDLPADTVEFVSVPAGVDPLMNGEVDALIGFLTNYPIAVKNAGGDVVTMSFADANYAQFGDAVVVSEKDLTENREALKAIMKASIEGWNAALDEGTDAVADIAMTYGGADNGLDRQLQVDSAGVLPSFMLTPDTVKNGIFTLTPELIDQAVASLAAAGITADPGMFDTSLLEEVYAENPDLIPGFTVPAS
jgi:ABC-type nitrate/sulfonate/bicarbonate transport system substrate-binding protein